MMAKLQVALLIGILSQCSSIQEPEQNRTETSFTTTSSTVTLPTDNSSTGNTVITTNPSTANPLSANPTTANTSITEPSTNPSTAKPQSASPTTTKTPIPKSQTNPSTAKPQSASPTTTKTSIPKSQTNPSTAKPQTASPTTTKTAIPKSQTNPSTTKPQTASPTTGKTSITKPPTTPSTAKPQSALSTTTPPQLTESSTAKTAITEASANPSTSNTSRTRPTTMSPIRRSTNITQAPDITYTCDGAGTFILNLSEASTFSHFVVTHNTTIDSPMYDENNMDSCTRKVTYIRGLENKTVYLTNCGDHVYFYTMNHSTSLGKVVGGASFHKYDLQCELPEKGVTYSVGVSYKNAQPSQRNQNKIPDLNLTLTFVNEDSIGQATFKIGDVFQLVIHDYSAAEHTMKLKSCKSFSDEAYSEDELVLYDRERNIWESDIFGDIDYDDDSARDMRVDLHAFRYPTSSTVYIQCMVYVCNREDAVTCGENTSKRRRRRSTNNPAHEVKGSFTVIETRESGEPNNSGQNTVLSWSFGLLSVSMVYMCMK